MVHKIFGSIGLNSNSLEHGNTTNDYMEVQIEDDTGEFKFTGKAKFLLILFGTIVGISLGCLVGFVAQRYLGPTPPGGAEFETVDDFRRTMLERDERDLQADGSVSLRSIIEPNESDDIIYSLRPGLDLKFQGVRVVTNSFGMRGPERTIEKPPGTYRVALLGDSFAFGWGVEERESFAQVTEDQLNIKLNKIRETDGNGIAAKLPERVEVLNFGVPGYSTFQETALFEQRAVKFSPDAVLVYFVENDFGLPFFIKSFHDGEAVVDSLGAVRNKAELSSDAKARKKALIARINPNRALKRLAAFCGERGIKIFFVINPGPREDKSRKKLWLLKEDTKVAERKDATNIKLTPISNITEIPVGNTVISILNLRPRILSRVEREKIPKKSLSLPTDPHPSPIKHAILGEYIADDIFNAVFDLSPAPQIAK